MIWPFTRRAATQDIAHNLKATLRAGDTVARWGGDEFVLLITGITDIDQIDETMRRVLAAVARSNTHSGGLPVSASIGVSIFPTDAQAPQTLFKNADAAMYEAKKRGGNCHVLHAAEPVPA